MNTSGPSRPAAKSLTARGKLLLVWAATVLVLLGMVTLAVVRTGPVPGTDFLAGPREPVAGPVGGAARGRGPGGGGPAGRRRPRCPRRRGAADPGRKLRLPDRRRPRGHPRRGAARLRRRVRVCGGQHRQDHHGGRLLPPGGDRREVTGRAAGELRRRVPGQGDGQRQQQRRLAAADAGHRLPPADRVRRVDRDQLRPGTEPADPGRDGGPAQTALHGPAAERGAHAGAARLHAADQQRTAHSGRRRPGASRCSTSTASWRAISTTRPS